MNGFEMHGLTHTSISQLNKWIEAPDVWVAHYLFNRRSGSSSAMWRGVFCEEAVRDIITETIDADLAIEKAIRNFDGKVMFDDDGSAAKERNNIDPMTRQAVAALKDFGKPNFPESGQHKVSMTARGDGWSLDCIGYIDFSFPDHGMIIDLKTTMRMPTVMSKNHQRQRAFYQRSSGNKAVKFLFVTPKKCEMKEDGDSDKLMAEIKHHLTRQERFLRLGDKELLRSIVPVSTDSYYWTGEETTRKELFGI